MGHQLPYQPEDAFGHWKLEFEYCLEFVNWYLGFLRLLHIFNRERESCEGLQLSPCQFHHYCLSDLFDGVGLFDIGAGPQALGFFNPPGF